MLRQQMGLGWEKGVGQSWGAGMEGAVRQGQDWGVSRTRLEGASG